MNYQYEGYFSSNMEEGHLFLKNLIHELSIAMGDSEIFQDLRLILSELVVNSILHGNSCDRNKYVFVKIKIGIDSIILQVEDQGQGIPSKCKQVDLMSTTGRGLKIVDCLADSWTVKDNKITVKLCV